MKFMTKSVLLPPPALRLSPTTQNVLKFARVFSTCTILWCFTGICKIIVFEIKIHDMKYDESQTIKFSKAWRIIHNVVSGDYN